MNKTLNKTTKGEGSNENIEKNGKKEDWDSVVYSYVIENILKEKLGKLKTESKRD